jgi:hypothetical protein
MEYLSTSLLFNTNPGTPIHDQALHEQENVQVGFMSGYSVPHSPASSERFKSTLPNLFALYP